MKNRVCKVEGCNSNYHAKEYCSKHYAQIKYYGKIKVITKYDCNQIIIKKTYAEIVLRNVKCEEVGRTLIDLEDVEKVKKYKWYLHKTNYCMTNINNKKIRLHRFLLRPKNKQLIDHINRDKLDNRKQNLRIVLKSINSFNCDIRKDNKSGVTGVYKKDSKWCSVIRKDKKKIYLGCFKDFQDAVKARKDAELKYFGEIIKR